MQRHHDRKEPFDPTPVHALQANLLAGYRDPDCRCRGWRFRRDGQLARQGIQTSQFPNATFKLTQPIELGPLPPDGQAVNVTAIGDFTLHGVTKPVQIALQAKRSGTTIAVTGSLPVKFADYGVSAPNSLWFSLWTITALWSSSFCSGRADQGAGAAGIHGRANPPDPIQVSLRRSLTATSDYAPATREAGQTPRQCGACAD